MSPYADKPISAWPKLTRKLLDGHALNEQIILDVALKAWDALWKTRIGAGETAIKLRELAVPATVVGYFFEVLFTKEMATRFPGTWRGCQQGDEKDLVYIPDPAYSVEIKTSGQMGLKVYGNRSYGQKLQNQQLAKKESRGSTSPSISSRELCCSSGLVGSTPVIGVRKHLPRARWRVCPMKSIAISWCRSAENTNSSLRSASCPE